MNNKGQVMNKLKNIYKIGKMLIRMDGGRREGWGREGEGDSMYGEGEVDDLDEEGKDNGVDVV